MAAPGPPVPAPAPAAAVDLEVKVSKLQRLYALTKKRLEDAQQKLAARDATIAEMSAANDALGSGGDGGDGASQYLGLRDLDKTTWTVVQCIRADHSDQVWCLAVEQGADDGSGDTGGADPAAAILGESLLGDEPTARSGWFLQDDIRDRLADEDADLPALAVSVDEHERVAAACEKATEELRSFKDEYRRYRIKTEMLLRQHESELQSMRDKSRSLQQTSISARDLEKDIEKLKSQVARLTKARSEQAETERTLRDEARATKDELKTARAQIARWRTKYDDAVRAGAAAIEAAVSGESTVSLDADGGGAAGASSGGVDAVAGAGGGTTGEAGADTGAAAQAARQDELAAEHEHLRKEYAAYRKRAVELLNAKDEEVARLKASAREAAAGGRGDGGADFDAFIGGMSGAGAGAGGGGGSVVGGGGAVGGVQQDSAAQHEYLKNVTLRYMTTDDDAVKTQMEAAIAAVLRLTPSELESVRAARMHGISDTIWTKASSWFASPPAKS